MNLQNSISLPEHIGGHERNVSGLIMDEENKHGDLEEAVGDMKEPTPAIPDGGYGWVCVVCMLLFTANTWGINGAFGVYLAHYLQTNRFPGTAETTYAFIGGLSISQITFVAPLVTHLSHSLGTHPTLCIGIVLETAALVSSSFATKTWHLFLAQGVCFGWGCSFLYVGSVGIVPQWFNKRRSFATAIAAAGSGLGGFAYSLGTEAMIREISLEWSFRITAIIAFSINTICTILMRDRNKEIVPNQHGFDLSLLKEYKLLLIIAWGWFSTLGYTIILFSLPDNALTISLTPSQGALCGALANLGMAIGRPTVGFFSDRVGRINMVLLATFLCAIFCLAIWTSANTYSVLLAFSILGGTVCGTFYAMVAPLLADCLGIKALPATLSIVWTSIVFPTTFAAPISLKLRQSRSPCYLPVELFTGFMFLASAICMLLLRADMVSNSESNELKRSRTRTRVRKFWRFISGGFKPRRV